MEPYRLSDLIENYEDKDELKIKWDIHNNKFSNTTNKHINLDSKSDLHKEKRKELMEYLENEVENKENYDIAKIVLAIKKGKLKADKNSKMYETYVIRFFTLNGAFAENTIKGWVESYNKWASKTGKMAEIKTTTPKQKRKGKSLFDGLDL